MTKAQGLMILLFGAVTGCSSGGEKAKDPAYGGQGSGVTAEDRSRCSAEGKRVVKLDLNRDKQPDVWKLYATKTEGGAKLDVLTCKEIDLNFDGRKDMWIYYDDRGNRKMEEMDLDFDGRIDLVSFLRGGKVIRQELDSNYDGKPDIWKYWENDVLVRVDRDSNNDNRVDFWEYYEGGTLDRIGYDKDGDGKVDTWERGPAKAEASGEGGGEAGKAAEPSGGAEGAGGGDDKAAAAADKSDKDGAAPAPKATPKAKK